MKTKMPKVAAIITTYNNCKNLYQCISSLMGQSLKLSEIIIVNNGSTDGVSEKILRVYPRVKVISLKRNLGVAEGRNVGIRAVNSRNNFLLFCDHDVITDKDMLKELLMIARENKNIGILTPKIYYLKDKKRIWSAGTALNLWTGQVIFRGGIENGQYNSVEEVQVAPAVFLVRKEVIKRITGFDGRYFATFEDTDFCFRARKEGFRVIYAPGATAYHDLPLDPKKEIIRLLSRSYFIGKNRILFMKKFGKNYFIFLAFLPTFVAYYFYKSLKYNRLYDFMGFMKGTLEGLVK